MAGYRISIKSKTLRSTSNNHLEIIMEVKPFRCYNNKKYLVMNLTENNEIHVKESLKTLQMESQKKREKIGFEKKA